VALATTTLADLKHSITEQFNYNNLDPTADSHGATKKSKQSKHKAKPTRSQQPPPVHLRIFHLGRELKSSGRSLEKLGVGRYRNNMILHVHVLPPSVPHALPSVSRTTTPMTGMLPTTTTNASSSLPPSLWAGTSLSTATTGTSTTTTTITITTTAAGKQVIELLDSDDDDGHPTNDNDDDTSSIVEVPPPTKKRQRV
jgi:hypothetical protein